MVSGSVAAKSKGSPTTSDSFVMQQLKKLKSQSSERLVGFSQNYFRHISCNITLKNTIHKQSRKRSAGNQIFLTNDFIVRVAHAQKIVTQ